MLAADTLRAIRTAPRCSPMPRIFRSWATSTATTARFRCRSAARRHGSRGTKRPHRQPIEDRPHVPVARERIRRYQDHRRRSDRRLGMPAGLVTPAVTPKKGGPAPLPTGLEQARRQYDGTGRLRQRRRFRSFLGATSFEPGLLLIPNTGTCAQPNFRNSKPIVPGARAVRHPRATTPRRSVTSTVTSASTS